MSIPIVSESIVISACLPMTTFIPDRVSVCGPGLPLETGKERTVSPPRVTRRRCCAMSTVVSCCRPMVIVPETSLPTHLSSPVWKPVSGASRVTVVPGF
nr:hypothetical protein [Janibacter melonis]